MTSSVTGLTLIGTSMRVLRWVPVSNVEVDRRPWGPTIFKLAIHLARGGTVPPIHVVQDPETGRFFICDGRHRIQAHRLIGRKHILAKYYKEVIPCD